MNDMRRVFACSDLHGMYNLYEQINEFLQPDDIVYFLGDAGDRGPRGWATIKAIYENPQWIYLKGNHEDMLVKAMQEYLEYDMVGEAGYLCFQNGGENTFHQWIAEGANPIWISRLGRLSAYKEYINAQQNKIALSHAGFTPYENWGGNYDQFLPPSEHALIWDRKHLTRSWIEREDTQNVIVVHGHTPNQHLLKGTGIEWGPGAISYCNGHKIDIDNCSFKTGFATLLDLDTLEEHRFQIGGSVSPL